MEYDLEYRARSQQVADRLVELNNCSACMGQKSTGAWLSDDCTVYSSQAGQLDACFELFDFGLWVAW